MSKNIVAIVQARMSSTRLPGKVLLELGGKTCIEQIYRRLQSCRTLNKIILATSTNVEDNPIEQLCKKAGLICFRGSLDDVLDRYYKAAKYYNADYIVRITADCPVIDPSVVDEVVTSAVSDDYDQFYLSGSFPDGLDVEVFKFQALEIAWSNAQLKSEREHVGPYFGNNPSIFKRGSIEIFNEMGHYRWTMDEPCDYNLIKIIYEKLDHADKIFTTKDIVDLYIKIPELFEINSGIIRNAGYALSLQNDELIR